MFSLLGSLEIEVPEFSHCVDDTKAHTLSIRRPVKVCWILLEVTFAAAWALGADGAIHKCFFFPPPSLGNLRTLSGPYEPMKVGAVCIPMPHK